VRRGKRHIVAVVFGGRTAGARDARVISLINNNIRVASAKRTAPLIVEGWETAQAHPKDVKHVKETKFVTAAILPPERQPAPGSTAPIKPNPVKTFTVHPGSMRTVSLSPLPSDSPRLAPAIANRANVTTVATVKGEAPPLPPPATRPGVLGVLPAKIASADDSVPVTSSVPEPAAKPRGGWMIQVGAFDDEKEAKHRLVAAQSKANIQLAKADSFTERVNKGEKALYRARFAGLEKHQAEAACKHLKRSDIPCMLLKN
jgi:D-alanyl-D-alanine carboxypeptidase